MNSRTTRRFRAAFRALPPNVSARARAAMVYGVIIPSDRGYGSSALVIKFRYASVVNSVRLAFCRVIQFLGIGSANMMNMTD